MDSISSLTSELRDLHAAHELELQVLLRRNQREREAVLRRFSSLSLAPPAPVVIHATPPTTSSTPQKCMGADVLDVKMGNGALTTDIMAFLDGSGEDGGNINEFIQMNKGKYSQDEIQAMFSHLETDGLVYTTTDENYYSATL